MTYQVADIGEILGDRFPEGDRLGGAAANFAFGTFVSSQSGVMPELPQEYKRP